LAEKLIAEDKLQEAKKLVNDFISENANEYINSWYELKLQIAQKEGDILEIRQASFRFIKSSFDDKYYKIYKSTFSKKEWVEKAEDLIQHYDKHDGKWFNGSVADVLNAERQKERLMNYITKYLSIDSLVKYYTSFSADFPEKTLALFRRAIDKYAKNNLGREHYERIAKLFEKMIKIDGGNELVKEMIDEYRILYKNRRAMMEIINR